jgi:hypothetical protein
MFNAAMQSLSDCCGSLHILQKDGSIFGQYAREFNKAFWNSLVFLCDGEHLVVSDGASTTVQVLRATDYSIVRSLGGDCFPDAHPDQVCIHWKGYGMMMAVANSTPCLFDKSMNGRLFFCVCSMRFVPCRTVDTVT